MSPTFSLVGPYQLQPPPSAQERESGREMEIERRNPPPHVLFAAFFCGLGGVVLSLFTLLHLYTPPPPPARLPAPPPTSAKPTLPTSHRRRAIAIPAPPPSSPTYTCTLPLPSPSSNPQPSSRSPLPSSSSAKPKPHSHSRATLPPPSQPGPLTAPAHNVRRKSHSPPLTSGPTRRRSAQALGVERHVSFAATSGGRDENEREREGRRDSASSSGSSTAVADFGPSPTSPQAQKASSPKHAPRPLLALLTLTRRHSQTPSPSHTPSPSRTPSSSSHTPSSHTPSPHPAFSPPSFLLHSSPTNHNHKRSQSTSSRSPTSTASPTSPSHKRSQSTSTRPPSPAPISSKGGCPSRKALHLLLPRRHSHAPTPSAPLHSPPLPLHSAPLRFGESGASFLGLYGGVENGTGSLGRGNRGTMYRLDRHGRAVEVGGGGGGSRRGGSCH